MVTVENNNLILDTESFTTKQIDAIHSAVHELKLQLDPKTASAFDQFIGKNVFVRTVTYHQIGKLVSYDGKFIALKDASWIADSGRWADALSKGTLSEVEPFPEGIILVNAEAIVDVCEWKHALPRVQK